MTQSNIFWFCREIWIVIELQHSGFTSESRTEKTQVYTLFTSWIMLSHFQCLGSAWSLAFTLLNLKRAGKGRAVTFNIAKIVFPSNRTGHTTAYHSVMSLTTKMMRFFLPIVIHTPTLGFKNFWKDCKLNTQTKWDEKLLRRLSEVQLYQHR